MTKRVADDTLGKLARKQNDLFRRVREGSLDFDQVDKGLQALIEQRALDGFVGETHPSGHGHYPPGFRVRTVKEQIDFWASLLPDLDRSHIEKLASFPLPQGAEGWGIIPNPQKLAGNYYSSILAAAALAKIGRDDPKGIPLLFLPPTPETFLRNEKSTMWLNSLCSSQPGDFLVFPFQFGLRHGARTVEEATRYFTQEEVGLGLYEVLCLMISHPDRNTDGYMTLKAMCPGCRVIPENGKSKGGFPVFRLLFDRPNVDTLSDSWSFTECGAVTAFALPRKDPETPHGGHWS